MLLIPIQEASLIKIQILVMFLFSHLNSTQSLPVQSLTILFQISFVSRYASFFFVFAGCHTVTVPHHIYFYSIFLTLITVAVLTSISSCLLSFYK